MNTDLVAWIRAQLDNDERVATNRGKLAGDVWTAVEIAPGRWEVIGAGGLGVVATGLSEWEAQHIAQYDPAWALTEVDAKRRIINEVKRIYDSAATGHCMATWTALPGPY